MPRNHTGLSEDERAAVVERAHALLAEGKSVTEAATDAGADRGISPATVRRYAKSAGRPLIRVTRQTAAATLARAIINADRQREQTQDVLFMCRQQLDVLLKQKPEVRDTAELNRVMNTLGRALMADRELLARLGPRPDETPAPSTNESVEEAAERIMAEQWAQWQQDRSAIGDEDT